MAKLDEIRDRVHRGCQTVQDVHDLMQIADNLAASLAVLKAEQLAQDEEPEAEELPEGE